MTNKANSFTTRRSTETDVTGHDVSLRQKFIGHRSVESSWNLKGLVTTVFMVLALSQGCMAQTMPQGPTVIYVHSIPQNGPVTQSLAQPSMLPFPQFSGATSSQPVGFPPNIFTFNPYGGGFVQPQPQQQQLATHTVAHIQPASGLTHLIHSSYNPPVLAPLQPSVDPTVTRVSIASPSFGVGLDTGLGSFGGSNVGGEMGLYRFPNPWVERMLKKRMKKRWKKSDMGVQQYVHPIHAMYFYPPSHPLSPFYKPKKPKCPKCKKCDECAKCRCQRGKRVYTESDMRKIKRTEKKKAGKKIRRLLKKVKKQQDTDDDV